MQSTQHTQRENKLNTAEVTQGDYMESGPTQTIEEPIVNEEGDEMYDTMRIPTTMPSGTIDMLLTTPQTHSIGTILTHVPKVKKARPESAIP